jgi:hypothetical protein
MKFLTIDKFLLQMTIFGKIDQINKLFFAQYIYFQFSRNSEFFF